MEGEPINNSAAKRDGDGEGAFGGVECACVCDGSVVRSAKHGLVLQLRRFLCFIGWQGGDLCSIPPKNCSSICSTPPDLAGESLVVPLTFPSTNSSIHCFIHVRTWASKAAVSQWLAKALTETSEMAEVDGHQTRLGKSHKWI